MLHSPQNGKMNSIFCINIFDYVLRCIRFIGVVVLFFIVLGNSNQNQTKSELRLYPSSTLYGAWIYDPVDTDSYRKRIVFVFNPNGELIIYDLGVNEPPLLFHYCFSYKGYDSFLGKGNPTLEITDFLPPPRWEKSHGMFKSANFITWTNSPYTCVRGGFFAQSQNPNDFLYTPPDDHLYLELGGQKPPLHFSQYRGNLPIWGIWATDDDSNPQKQPKVIFIFTPLGELHIYNLAVSDRPLVFRYKITAQKQDMLGSSKNSVPLSITDLSIPKNAKTLWLSVFTNSDFKSWENSFCAMYDSYLLLELGAYPATEKIVLRRYYGSLILNSDDPYKQMINE